MSEASGAIRGFFVACRSGELAKEPLRVWFAGAPRVLFREPGGRARALLDRCPHRGVPLSQGTVVDGTLACPYHGYRYDGAGACVHLPGLGPEARLPKTLACQALEVVEQDGFVWLAEAPLAAGSVPPRLPWRDHADYHTMVWRLTAQGTLLDGLENFLDATHTHYVHGGLIRRPSQRRLTHVEVRREGPIVEARYLSTSSEQPGSHGLISRLLGRDIDGRYGRFVLPCVAQLEYRRAAETAMVISALFTPQRERELAVWAVVTTRKVARVPDVLVRALVGPLFRVAVWQDRRMLGLVAQGQRDFPAARAAPSPTDVLRPHIEAMLRDGPQPRFEKRLTLAL